MKKVKIMLTAVAVLGVVGAGLAFKAKSPLRIYTTNNAFPGAKCPLASIPVLTSDVGTQISGSVQQGGTCITYTTVDFE